MNRMTNDFNNEVVINNIAKSLDNDLKSDNLESMTVDQIAAQLHVPIELLKLRLMFK